MPDGFWNDVAETMEAEFRKGLFAEGLAKAAEMVGEKLKGFFPYQDDDVNELPDDISFAENDKE